MRDFGPVQGLFKKRCRDSDFHIFCTNQKITTTLFINLTVVVANRKVGQQPILICLVHNTIRRFPQIIQTLLLSKYNYTVALLIGYICVCAFKMPINSYL